MGISVASDFYLQIVEYGDEVEPTRKDEVLDALKVIQLEIEYEDDPSPEHVVPEEYRSGWVSVAFEDWGEEYLTPDLKLDVMSSIWRLTWVYGPREIRLAELLWFNKYLSDIRMLFWLET